MAQIGDIWIDKRGKGNLLYVGVVTGIDADGQIHGIEMAVNVRAKRAIGIELDQWIDAADVAWVSTEAIECPTKQK